MSYTQKSLCTCTVSHSPEHSVQLLGFKSKQLYAVCHNAAMPPRRKLSGFDRGRAIGWVQDGVPKREVARRLQVSMSVIVRLTQRFNATGSVQERPRTGRPKKTTQREDRYISRQALQTRTASASNIRRQLLAANNNNVSEQTIRRRLHGFQLRSRRPAVRPRLTQAHRVARLAFSRQHLRWTRQQWATVLFSDESRFMLNHNDGRLRVWRRPRERFIDATVQERVAHGGGSVMVWGAFSLHHRTPLHRVQGNLTGLRYRDEILRPFGLPTLHQMGPHAIFQDDNARPHRARVVNDFLQQSGVHRMDWPACSPDLNPIEHLWDELDRRVRNNHPPPRDVDHLFQLLQVEWQALPQRTLTNLINSMRRRCVECHANHGGHTHY
jgi:transposase